MLLRFIRGIGLPEKHVDKIYGQKRKARGFQQVKGILLVHPCCRLAILHIQLRTRNHSILCALPNMSISGKKFTYFECLMGKRTCSSTALEPHRTTMLLLDIFLDRLLPRTPLAYLSYTKRTPAASEMPSGIGIACKSHSHSHFIGYSLNII